MIQLFSVEAIRAGWSIWWRSWLLLIMIAVPIILVAQPMMVRLPFLILALSIIGNLGLIVLLDRAGKIIARKRYQTEVRRFIGWSLWWRMMLMGLILAIPATLGLILFFKFLQPNLALSPHQTLVFNVVSNACGALIRIILVMVACGWSLGRVLQRIIRTR